MKFHQHKLDNGLTLIGEERETAFSAAMGFFVRTGARDESPELAGVSHFLEHMMFKGTEKRSAMDITFELGAIGAQANAWTSEENTVYYMGVLPEYFDSGLDLLCDMLRPSLDQKEFDTEKNVILEEIALYKDRPTHVLFESAMAEFFTGHTAGNTVLGSSESISALSRDQMLGYFEKRYAPSNMIFVCTGKIDWEKTVAEVDKRCGAWKDYRSERAYPKFNPEKRSKTITKKGLQGAHVCLVAPGPTAADDDRYAAQVLTCMLGDSSGSQAYWEIVDRGLAEVAVMDSDQMDQAGLIYAYSSTDPSRIDDVSARLGKIIRGAADSLEEDAFERARTKIASRLVLQGETSMRRLMAVGSEWSYRQRYSALEDEVQKIGQLTLGDLKACLEKYPLDLATEVKLLPA